MIDMAFDELFAQFESSELTDERKEELEQNWKGMLGGVAFSLIERHADNWKETDYMMNQWIEANMQEQQAQVAELKAQLNNMEQCYAGKCVERNKRVEEGLELIKSLYKSEFSQRSNPSIHISQIREIEKALRGEP